MLLPPTTTNSPATDGPPHGLSGIGAFHTSEPSLADRQYTARSPTCSLSRKAVPTSTLSPTTATGASTCHFSLPACHASTGAGLGSISSVGLTAKSGSFLRSSWYLACSSAHFLARAALISS